MTARAAREDGASLILALIFLTTIGIAAAAIASLGFTSQRAAAVYTDQGRLVNALDGRIQAAIENARVSEPFGCDSVPGPVPGPADVVEAAGLHISLGCGESAAAGPPTQTRAELCFTAQYVSPPSSPASQLPSIRAIVSFSTIGDAPTGARIARTRSWEVVPPTPCPT